MKIIETGVRALAQLTQEDVFRSIQQNVGEAEAVSGRIIAALLMLLAMVVIVAIVQHHRKRQTTPTVLNDHGKLIQEVMQRVEIDAKQLHRLRSRARREGVCSPLVLMLCESKRQER